jgi:hypothetical protein
MPYTRPTTRLRRSQPQCLTAPHRVLNSNTQVVYQINLRAVPTPPKLANLSLLANQDQHLSSTYRPTQDDTPIAFLAVCSASIPGVLVVTASRAVPVSQSGRKACADWPIAQIGHGSLRLLAVGGFALVWVGGGDGVAPCIDGFGTAGGAAARPQG